MRKIILSKGKFALVDDDCYEELIKHKWYYNDEGYACRKEMIPATGKYKSIRMHRQILNAPRNLEVDHVNGNRLDNRKSNLRLCTSSQNKWNMSGNSNTTSKYRGVYYYKSRGNWRALIKKDGKLYHIGYFKKEIDAAIAWNKKAIELYGSYAKLNKI